MSRQVRHRLTAVVLGGLLLGAPLLTNGTANAEQAEAGGRQIVFAGGGVLGLSCRSTPEVGTMTVPADSTVRVVNRTGHSAKLRLGGTVKGTVPDDGATEVVFRRGTTAVLLSPSCALGAESTPVLITATPSAPATMPDPTPDPSDGSAGPVSPSTPGSPSATGGTTMPDTVTPPTRSQGTPPRTKPGTTGPGTTKPGTTRPDVSRPTGPMVVTAVPAMPQGGAASRIRTRTTRGTGTTAPTFAGMPPGDRRTIVGGGPSLTLPSTTDAAPAAPAVPPTTIAAAEPVAAMEPMSEGGPIGLLAVVAGVCVVGVAAGAIRAFAAERASRATMA
jgi:hypothetical protein